MDQLNMFAQDENEVTTSYVDGTLQIVVNRSLDRSQVKAFCRGIIAVSGIKNCELDNLAQFASSYTAFCVVFRAGYAPRIEEIRTTCRAYAVDFMANLQPTAQQVSLF